MNYGRAYSPPCEGGVSAPSKNGSVPKTARTGWSLTSYVSKCVLKHWLVSDHPVCGASVAARLFIDAAATPPLQGGECAPLNSSAIHSHLHRPPLQFQKSEFCHGLLGQAHEEGSAGGMHLPHYSSLTVCRRGGRR